MLHTESIKLTDEELIKRVAGGNNLAFDMLYHRYKDRIYSYIRHLLNFNDDEAQEAISETFIKIYICIIDKKQTIKHFKSFIYRTSHNTAINLIKKETNQTFVETEDLQYMESKEQENMKDIIDNQYRQELLQDLLQRLEPKYREVLYLYYFEKYDYEEIAELLGSNKNTVGTLISRAKSQFKTLVKKYGYDKVFIN